jgi:hypothetical protein
MCEVTTTEYAEPTVCEWCLEPMLFTSHPQLCFQCLNRFHARAETKELVDITSDVHLVKQPEHHRWVVQGKGLEGLTIRDVAFIQTDGVFRLYRIQGKG